MTQELYALGANRSAAFALTFLDHFASKRKPSSEDYPVPELSEKPDAILETDLEILAYLETHPNEPYGLYWNNLNSNAYEMAMLFYTTDGMVIFGLAVDEPLADEKLSDLRSFIGTEWAMKGWEQRPPDTSAEFIALCQKPVDLDNTQRYARFEQAFREALPLAALKEYALALSKSGMKRRAIYEKFLEFHGILQNSDREKDEELLGDVMDMITNSFAPENPNNMNLPE